MPRLRWWLPTAAVLAVVAAFTVPQLSKRNSEPYRQGLAQIRLNAEVISILGEPVHSGRLLRGGVAGGEADLRFTLKGPLNRGQARISAQLTEGEWRLDRVMVEVPDMERHIDVVGGYRESRR